MTDGIIQKVIRKYILDTRLQYESKNVAYQIEQELIEKIELIHPLHDSAFCSTCELKKWLIGDNQE